MDRLIIQLSGAAVCLILLTMISAAGALVVMVAGGVIIAVVGIQLYRLHIRSIEAGIKQAETAASFQAVSSPHGVLSLHNGVLQFWTKQSANIPGEIPCDLNFMQGERLPDLLDTVSDLDCLMVWGGRGAGKTNFLQWLASAKSANGEQLIIIDPKPSKAGKWPGSARIVGHGHNYSEIEMIAQFYQDELETRKQIFPEIAAKTTIIIDELYLLNMKIPGFMDMVLPALLEGREYNIHLILISQSKTAASMGLKGRYDLIECFDAVIGLKKQGGSYQAVMDLGEGDQPYRPPGKFTQVNHVNSPHTHPLHGDSYTATHHYEPDVNQPYMPGYIEYTQCKPHVNDHVNPSDPLHAQIISMYQAGESLNSIAKAVYGSTGGNQNKKIKEILRQYNLI